MTEGVEPYSSETASRSTFPAEPRLKEDDERLWPATLGGLRSVRALRTLRRLVLGLLVGGILAPGVAAQRHYHDVGNTNELKLISTNALVHGVVAAIRAKGGDGDVGRAFLTGLAGGAVSYGGKRLIGTSLPGKYWIARSVGAIGHAMTDNAARGEAWYSRFWVPVGPLALEVTAQTEFDWAVSVNVMDILRTGHFVLSDDFRFDLGRSLELGVPMFWGATHRSLDDYGGNGIAAGSTVVLEPLLYPDQVIDHEYVHVIQNDTEGWLVFDPIERWIAGKFSLDLRVGRFRIRPGLLRHGFRSSLDAFGWLDGYQGPLEREAFWIETRF